MARPFHHFRLTWIALTAILGAMSWAGEASACGSNDSTKAARSCCVDRPVAGECDCCGSSDAEVVAKPGTPSVAPASFEPSLASSQQDCSCRSDQPSAPASKSESRPVQTRADQDCGSDVAFVVVQCRSTAVISRRACSVYAPALPIFLATSRILL